MRWTHRARPSLSACRWPSVIGVLLPIAPLRRRIKAVPRQVSRAADQLASSRFQCAPISRFARLSWGRPDGLVQRSTAMPETPDQMHDRLLGVIAKSRFEALSQPYAWQGIPDSRQVPDGSLAAVRDGDAWYALSPASQRVSGNYRGFGVHFAEGTNASGFVAWLAGIMKQDVGTGVMVVCGFDARSTPALWQTSLGLFDYGGCPWIKGGEVIALVEPLRRIGSS